LTAGGHNDPGEGNGARVPSAPPWRTPPNPPPTFKLYVKALFYARIGLNVECLHRRHIDRERAE